MIIIRSLGDVAVVPNWQLSNLHRKVTDRKRNVLSFGASETIGSMNLSETFIFLMLVAVFSLHDPSQNP